MYVHSLVSFGEKNLSNNTYYHHAKGNTWLGEKVLQKKTKCKQKENFLLEKEKFFLKGENGSKEKSEIILSNEILGYVSC